MAKENLYDLSFEKQIQNTHKLTVREKIHKKDLSLLSSFLIERTSYNSSNYLYDNNYEPGFLIYEFVKRNSTNSDYLELTQKLYIGNKLKQLIELLTKIRSESNGNICKIDPKYSTYFEQENNPNPAPEKIYWLHIVIIEDIESIRENTKRIIWDELWKEFDINFSEVDNYKEAINEIIYRICFPMKRKVFYILDNYFYPLPWDSCPQKDMGLELYLKLEKSYWKELLKQIVVVSSDNKIKEKFPEWANIISGKSEYDLSYINEIVNFIKESLNKS